MNRGGSGFAGNAVPFGVEKQLQSAGKPELGVNRIEMIAQGVFADVEPLGDDLAGRRGIHGYFGYRLDFALGQTGDFLVIGILVQATFRLGQMIEYSAC